MNYNSIKKAIESTTKSLKEIKTIFEPTIKVLEKIKASIPSTSISYIRLEIPTYDVDKVYENIKRWNS